LVGRIVARIVLLLVVIASAIAAACESKVKEGSRGSSAASDEFRALVYSKGFAERFHLPASDSVVLDPGVLAIAIQVYRDPSLNKTCLLSLYLDDSVPVAYPAGTQSRSADRRPQTGPLFFANKLNDSDALVQLERSRDVRVLFKSRNYSEAQKEGVVDSGPIESHYRDILPGLNVVEYVPICISLDPKYAPADIWLLRDGRESTDVASFVPTNTIRIAIPESLMQVAASATMRAAAEPVKFKPAPPPVYVVPPRTRK
jgi:hypothetical protein